VAALVIGVFVFLSTVTGSWTARYVTPMKQPVFSADLETVNYRRTTDTVVTFGFQLKFITDPQLLFFTWLGYLVSAYYPNIDDVRY
jgi:hypothetical protein